MRPTQSTLKRLFALSGNQCAFPKCRAPLTHNDTLLGEVCHIKADSPDGPRYHAAQTDADRQAFDTGADQLLRSIRPANVVEYVKVLQVFGLQSAFDHLEEQFMAEAKMKAV